MRDDEIDELAVDEAPLVADDRAQKNPHAMALGRLGGRRGGPARAVSLSAERRSEIARLAAQARWQTQSSPQEERQ